MKRIAVAVGLLGALGSRSLAQDTYPVPRNAAFVEVEWKRSEVVEQTNYQAPLPPADKPATLPAVSAPVPETKYVISSTSNMPASAVCLPDCCVPCGPQGRLWFEGEYLLWWAKGASSVPLATVSAPGTALPGTALGSPGTTTVFGNQQLNNELQMGFQARAGLWLDSCHKWGLEGGFLFLGGDNSNFFGGSPDGSTIVSRPFFNANTGASDSQLVAFPGIVGGSVAIDTAIPQIWGYDVLMRRQLCCNADPGCDPCGTSRFSNYRRWDLLLGYRHYEFSDRVDITENLFPLSPAFVPGTQIIVQDHFRARTRFDGIVLGLAGQRAHERWVVQGAIKLNVGQVTRDVSINGQTTVIVPGDVTTVSPGGLLALGSNSGSYRDSEWTLLPEAQLRLGYRITPRMTAYAGYNVIIWPKVARAAEQIDPVVNTNQLPPPIDPLTGPARPTFFGNTSTLWIQGVSLGIDLRF